MSDLNEAKDLLDLMDKWLVPPIVAENEQLKARVVALEAEVARLTAEQLEKEAHMDCYQYGTVPAERARVPPDRERLAARLTEIADGKQEWDENWTEIEIMREAAIALRTPAAVPPDRERLARWLTEDADLIQGNLPGIAHRIRSAAAALRALNIPSPPAKEKSLATFGPPDAGYYREETP